MAAVQLIPVILSLLVLGAHFLRSARIELVAALLLLALLLAVPRAWVARLVQVVLVLGALEWIRTAVVLASRRLEVGEPAVRMVLILGGVAVSTGLSVLVFRSSALRRRYKLR